MADLKISALTASTVPLAGTEVLPIVQSSTTKQVSVANLTAGRATTMLSLNLTSGNNTTALLSNAATTGWQNWVVSNTSGKIYLGVEGSTAGTFCVGDTAYDAVVIGKSGISFSGNDGNATHLRLDSTGNLAVKTAAKGFNFTANTPAAGMTSQLLNWYEEGTWTPNQGAGLTVVGTFSSSGTYTRIGRQVTVSIVLAGSTSISVSTQGVLLSNLPFVTVGGVWLGNVTDNNAVVTTGCAVLASSPVTQLWAMESRGATPQIFAQITYMV